MFFLVSVSKNYALNFNILATLHMIFRVDSMIANMLVGIALLGKRHSVTKYASVVMITAGIDTCTVMSAKADGKMDSGEKGDMLWLAASNFLLTIALFLSAVMGIYHEIIYEKYGMHPKEALSYFHALLLLGFLLFSADIAHQ